MKDVGAAADTFDVAVARAEFPVLGQPFEGKKLVYLDSACTALKPRSVIDAMSRFYERLGGCGGKRSSHLMSQAVEETVARARQAAADFLGAEAPSEIVFVSGTTEAANLLARAFPYGDRRRVVISDLEHNAVFLPFYEAARRGEIELEICPSRAGRVQAADLRPLVGEKTALVAVTHASNVAGGAQPLTEICRLAHAQGAMVFTDDAQYVSSHREDVGATNVDFAAFSAHKIGGPFGLGVLYGKEHALNRLGPGKVGGGAVKSVRLEGGRPQVEYLDAPMRFEAGVPNLGAFPGLIEAIELVRSWPERALREHLARLVRRAAQGLGRLPQVRVVGDVDRLAEGSLVSFFPADERFSVADFNLFLNHELGDRFIAVRAGEHCAHLFHQAIKVPATVRVSFFAYNTAEEVDLFLDALQAYLGQACA